jgi:hypothetical protein
MTTSAMHVPRYTALSYDGECVEADNELAVVLAALAKTFDAADPEELAVWRDAEVIVAVQKADGRIIHLEPVEPAPPSKPPARASNGRGRGRRP